MKKNTKKISIKVWIFILLIIITIALIVGAFFAGMYINNKKNMSTNDSFKKWGITFTYAEDPYFQDYQVTHKETDDTLNIGSKGKYLCPKPGEKKYLEYCELSGNNEKPLSFDTTAKIVFSIGSFMQNNTFYCPLIFHAGSDDKGNPKIINGNDYIGKKYEFEKAISDEVSKSDVDYIAKGTNVSEAINKMTNDYYVEFPSDKADLYDSLSNANYEFEYDYVIKEVK